MLMLDKVSFKMNITPKSPEHLQTQIYEFSHGTLSSVETKAYLHSRLGEVAQLGIGDTFTIPDQYESIHGFPDFHYGKDLRYSDYLGFLRLHRTPEERDLTHTRAALLENFAQFEPEVEAFLQNHPSAETMAAQLGAGHHASAYRIEHNSKSYALRISSPFMSSTRADVSDEHVLAPLKVLGEPHLEQIVALSYEKGLTVAEIMPGKPLSELKLEDMHNISSAQILDFVHTLLRCNAIGITVDSRRLDNFLYDEEKGFGVVDLEDRHEHIYSMLCKAIKVLEDMGDYSQPISEISQVKIGILQSFQEALDSALSSVPDKRTQNYIKQVIEGTIAQLSKSLNVSRTR